MHPKNIEKPFLGFGLGLRTDYYETILQEKPSIDWFEIITENYLVDGGKPLYYLNQIREHYPLVMHGVSLSIGSTDSLDWEYLKKVKALAEQIQPAWISDHLCWTGIHGKNAHDLLPLPYTEETVSHVAERIQQVQEYLGRQILIENVSSYLNYKQSTLTEWEFITEVCQRSDCHLLLDINNIYVSSINHRFDALHFIEAIPSERIYQIHLAGHSDLGSYIIDTHDNPIVDAVWDLYAAALKRHGKISTMIERDDNMPQFPELLLELKRAKTIAESVFLEVVT